MDKIQKTREFEYKPGHSLPFGVTKVADGVQFAIFIPDRKRCFFNLYRRGQKKPECRIELSRQFQRGSVYFVTITGCTDLPDDMSLAGLLSRDYEYGYEADGEEFADPYAAVIYGRDKWGKRRESARRGVRSGICLEDFDWQGDYPLRIDFSDMILYQLHVRGFTKHASSQVAHRGTFAGLQEKIGHLQDLGINAVLLLPCYDFDEILSVDRKVLGEPKGMGEKRPKTEVLRLNYWGYSSADTYYFAPKASYAAHPDRAPLEMKEMVWALHQAGIEVLLDIYFTPGTNISVMEDCLRNWVLEYHIDGFRVNQEVMPEIVIVSDPVLSGVKLLTSYWDVDKLRRRGAQWQDNVLAEYNEGFMNCARRFLKSDEGQVEEFARYFRRNASDHSVINFMTYVNGFTMMDLVSYDVKHNGANGEMNQDGTQYNYSWNCGVEGKTRKKTVISQRMCQIRNAFAMLLLAQGTPMLLAGDEFGNSQNGNNNPYCQDNAITWLDWKQMKTKSEIYDYVKKLIAFRKEHPVLHRKEALYLFDTLSCGMPDLSMHGTQAWRTDFSYYSRMLAMLYYGEYQKKEDGAADDSVYIIFNMYWEAKSFDLPNLPKDKEWYPVMETYGNTFSEVPPPARRKKRVKKPSLVSQKKTVVPPRSIVVFIGR